MDKGELPIIVELAAVRGATIGFTDIALSTDAVGKGERLTGAVDDTGLITISS
jgi:hypothetical protein